MNEKKPKLKQIKQRHHLIICGPCTSAVRVLLRSKILCRDHLSLCSENWSYAVQWKKRREGEGRSEGLNILFPMEVMLTIIIRLNYIKHFLCVRPHTFII